MSRYTVCRLTLDTREEFEWLKDICKFHSDLGTTRLPDTPDQTKIARDIYDALVAHEEPN